MSVVRDARRPDSGNHLGTRSSGARPYSAPRVDAQAVQSVIRGAAGSVFDGTGFQSSGSNPGAAPPKR